eukprot:CAMPEP_0113516820 /NCGR_PEP_ID=MMETSP0014_2-20120614/41832_1 /TAXON_ID=2857 /ORGANISM="Nitzschia sp." /LENGTH=740 /DNA_ID=CAMNT_0000413781 /DNA_START=130 /DNA_END=2352 /DNA_ORIENTATION=- /assembly_acc=CAM_ASM_000159
MKRSRADLRPRARAVAVGVAGVVAEDTDRGGREATDGSGSETETGGPGYQRVSEGSGQFLVTKRSRRVSVYSMKMTSLLLVLSLVLTAMSALRSTLSTLQAPSSVLFVSAFGPSSRSACHGGHKIKDRIRVPPYRTLSLSTIEDGNNNKRLNSKNTFLMFQPTSSTSTDNEPRRSFRIHYFFSSSSSSSSSVTNDDDDDDENDDENDDIGLNDNENIDADDDESVDSAVGQNEDGSPTSVATTTNLKSSQSSSSSNDSDSTSRQRIRRRVRQLAKSVVSRPLALATTVPVPSAIAAVLKEASVAAVEQVEDAITQQDRSRKSSGSNKAIKLVTEKKLQTISSAGKRGSGGDENDDADSTLSTTEMIESIIDDAFAPMEVSLHEMETSLVKARAALDTAKQQSYEAMEALQVAAEAQAQGAAEAVVQVEKAAQRQVMVDIYESSGAASTIAASSSSSLSSSPAGTTDVIDDISKLTFDDVDYDSSEMAPPFLDPDSCLVPGEPVIRVEKAPENSRRIFAGIDIMASVDDVWNVLTKYNELQNVIPNLVVNDVLELYDGVAAAVDVNDLDDENIPEEVKCKDLAEQMKGSLLKQIGGAKVAGINFSARTTLEVREWPNGMPDFAHFRDDMYEGKSRETRAREYPKVKLKRYRFPRPFALSRLPTRDISMQSIVEDDGEFRLYQGVWRMQPLPGCAPPGKEAMRLTYAVEISPRAYLPVKLVEGRIVKDLATNLLAIRNAVTA